MTYYKYKEKYIYNGEHYELHSVISGDEETTKPTFKLLSLQELVSSEYDGEELIVEVYVKYIHRDNYTTLGYKICK